jgi:hypothetical protein
VSPVLLEIKGGSTSAIGQYIVEEYRNDTPPARIVIKNLKINSDETGCQEASGDLFFEIQGDENEI